MAKDDDSLTSYLLKYADKAAKSVSQAYDKTMGMPEEIAQQTYDYVIAQGGTEEQARGIAGRLASKAGRTTAALDFMIPQSAADVALMAAGPLGVGTKAGKAALAAGSGLMVMDPTEAEAGALSKLSQAIKAWHGSPYKFDKFDLSKRGAGEGTAAYGEGAYLSASRKEGETWRDRLSAKAPFDIEYEARNLGLPVSRAAQIEIMRQARGRFENPEDAARWAANANAELRDAPRDKVAELVDKYRTAKKGQLYEVDIHSNPESLLNLQRSVQDQPDVAARLRQLGAIDKDGKLTFAPNDRQITGMELYKQLSSPSAKGLTGGDGSEAASRALKDAGVPGMSYRGPSSFSGTPYENYVMFDPDLLEIVGKYAEGGAVQGYAVGGDVTDEGLEKLFVDYFGRGSDPGGLKYWKDTAAENQLTLEDIGQKFSESQEYQDQFAGPGVSSNKFAPTSDPSEWKTYYGYKPTTNDYTKMLQAALGEVGVSPSSNQYRAVYEALGNRAAANTISPDYGRGNNTIASLITPQQIHGVNPKSMTRVNSYLRSTDPSTIAAVAAARASLDAYLREGQNRVLTTQTDWRGFQDGEPSPGVTLRGNPFLNRNVPDEGMISLYNTYYDAEDRPDIASRLADLQRQANAIWTPPTPEPRPTDAVLAQVQTFTDEDGRQFTETDGARRYLDEENPLDTNQTAGRVQTANVEQNVGGQNNNATIGDDYNYAFIPGVTPGADTGLGVSTYDPNSFKVYRNDSIDQNSIQQNQLADNTRNWQQDFNNVVGGQFNMSNPGLVGGYNSSNIGGFDYSGLGNSLGNVGATSGFGLNTGWDFGGGWGFSEGGPVDLRKMLEGEVAQAEAVPPELAPADVELAPLEAIKAASAPVNPRAGTGIGGALSRIGQGISDSAIVRGFGEIPGTVGNYFSDVTAGPDPSQRLGQDLGWLGSKVYEGVKADPVGAVLDVLPVVGEIRSGMDASKYSDAAVEAEIAGDEPRASMFRQLAAMSTAGAAPILGVGARLAKRGAKAGTEGAEASVRQGTDAASDAAKLAENASEIERAAEITKKADRPHNPDTVGAEARDSQPITGGNEDFQFTSLEREAREKGKARLTAEQKETVSKLAEGTEIPPAKVEEAVREKLRKYPASQGWEPFEVVGFEKDPSGKIKVDDKGLPELKLREQPYAFNQKKGEQGRVGDTDWDPKHIDTMADTLVKEVKDVANRSDAGDKNASVIMAARSWYATMRDRLRQEYGGFADVMADVLGTTSAQTGVRQNWDNTIEVLSQFSRGAYDRALTKLQDWLDAGGEMGSAGAKGGTGYINRHLDDVRAAMPDAIKQATDEGFKGAKPIEKRAKEIAFRKAQEGDFPLITKADGKTLFNANSPQTMMALLDKFRERKVGDAPKTPNFTGNLIGYSDKATIDLWAARLLRRLSGRGRIVPGAESGVSGGVLAGPLPSGIGVGGEFGFGQEVFQKAAKRLRDEDPRFANLGDDDLQAIAWFLEKETWGKKGYTTKAGEGGSMELEANFAGVSDRELLKETRKQAETDPTFTERNKLEKELADKKTVKARQAANEFYEENKWILDMTPAGRRNSLMESQGLDKDAATKAATDLLGKVRQAGNLEKSFATKEGRLATLEERSKTGPEQARATLEEMQAIARRFTGGLSQERPDIKPTPESMQAGSRAVAEDLYKNPNVIMYKATPSQGRYIDPQGNIFDETAFDLEFVTRQNFDPNPTFRKMVEEARAKNQDSTFLSEVVEPGTVPNANPGVEVYFTKKVGPDVVDSLTKTINQLGVDAGFTFVTDFRAKNRAAGGENVGEYVGIRMQYIPEFGNGVEGLGAAKKKMYEALNQIAEFDGVSTARYVEYDTQVAFKGDYDAVIAGSLPGDRRASWAGKQSRESGQATDRGEGVLKRAVGGAVLHRRTGGRADVEAPVRKAQGGVVRYAEGGEVNFKKMFEGDSEAMQERARELAREAYSKGYSSLGKKKAEEWEALASKYNLPLSVGPFDNYEDQYSDAVSKWQRGLSPKQRVQTYDEGGPVKADLATEELTSLQKILAGSNPAANVAPFQFDFGGGSQARGRVVQAGPYIDIGGGITLPLRDVMLMLDASYGKVPGTDMKPNISVKGGLRIPFAEGGAVTPYNADEIAALANQIYEGTNG